MASLAHTGPTAGRWTLAALLRRLQPPPRPRRVEAVATAAFAEADPSVRRAKRHYAPQRDAVFEHSAMAREMFRL